MNASMDRSVRMTRFAISDLQKRIAVLEATREDLERQMRKLMDSVPENEVDASAHKDGYVAYGSYAQSVVTRKKNLEMTLSDIDKQNSELSKELQVALDSLDSFERVRARRLASKAERGKKSDTMGSAALRVS